MTLNELRDLAYTYGKKQGFHEQPTNFGESLMLIVSELSEALEADRNGKWYAASDNPHKGHEMSLLSKEEYEISVHGTVEEEIADAIIRLCDLAGTYKINLNWHVAAKMHYKETRPYKHRKKY
jgi:NTP pyrophosphatase (non-canonical NTP hydrolase)